MNLVEPIREKQKLEEVKAVLEKSGKRNLLLFVFGINIGLRISDILPLKIKDVKNKTHIEIFEKKTGKRKKFPLNKKLKSMIKSFISGKSGEDYLFEGRLGRPLSRFQAYNIIKNAAKQAGVDDKIGTHSLRKTFGYHHYKKFKDIAMLQMILNHSSPVVTLKYIGINQDIIDKSYKNFEL